VIIAYPLIAEVANKRFPRTYAYFENQEYDKVAYTKVAYYPANKAEAWQREATK